ncbi:Nramp family divalent metal transporter [Pacificimonas aurantium]|uniref:Nramp family divalent metal transporter n=1 Tax=Pacificimonas aurantium TaxID=1250540 RepID=A0ABS7WMY9_9SPHN|nr:Nramp family divalent metal transporter [Pacificimonas aurantium]
MVAAAFIGPGTVTTCTVAGASFGYALLWALLFATAATMGLQEMAARLGAAGRMGLGEALRADFDASALKWPLAALVVLAIFAGNAAYEGGNLAGAALGAEALGLGDGAHSAIILGCAVLAALLLLTGSYRHIERALIGLVLVMAVAFIGAAILVRPDFGEIAAGLFVPELPAAGTMTALALIGTTVVPYNLFLHASASKARWSGPEDLGAARSDTILSVGLGGVVSMMIVATAAASLFRYSLEADSAAAMAAQLEPVAGRFAPLLLGGGLLAAGLTSSITAPLATGYAVAGLFGWRADASARGVKGVAVTVILVGAVLGTSGTRPVDLILAAQVANGLLLPIIAIFLLWAMNRRARLGAHANGLFANVVGVIVVAVTLLLGARLVGLALGLL